MLREWRTRIGVVNQWNCWWSRGTSFTCNFSVKTTPRQNVGCGLDWILRKLNSTCPYLERHAVTHLVESLHYNPEGRGVRFPMLSHNPSTALWPLGLTQPLTEMNTTNISLEGEGGGKGGRCLRLTTFMCRLSGNLGASTSWNPQGLSRRVMGLLFIFTLS